MSNFGDRATRWALGRSWSMPHSAIPSREIPVRMQARSRNVHSARACGSGRAISGMSPAIRSSQEINPSAASFEKVRARKAFEQEHRWKRVSPPIGSASPGGSEAGTAIKVGELRCIAARLTPPCLSPARPVRRWSSSAACNPCGPDTLSPPQHEKTEPVCNHGWAVAILDFGGVPRHDQKSSVSALPKRFKRAAHPDA